MKITKDLAIALGGSNNEEESLINHYNEMIKGFLNIESNRTLLVNHAVSKYLATKFLNKTNLHEFNLEIVSTFVSKYVNFIASSTYINYYFLPFKEIARLTYGYATMFNNITYHEYVVTKKERDEHPVVNVKDYFYNMFHGINFISESDYAILSGNNEKLMDLNVSVTLGMKYVNERLEK